MRLWSYFLGAICCMLSLAWADRPSHFPATVEGISCQEYWEKQQIDGQYQYATDAEFSALGNTGHQNYFKRIQRDQCLKAWTVLIYMAADNDLSPYALWDIEEMEKLVPGAKNLGASTLHQDVLVELDTWGRAEGRRRLHIFQTQEQYDIDVTLEHFKQKTAAQIHSPIVEHFSEANEAFPLWSARDRFTDFLKWGMLNYPSQHYMLVVWGHGEGYVGKYTRKEIEALRERYRTPKYLAPNVNEKTDHWNYPDFTPKVFPIDKLFGGVAMDYSDASLLDIPSIKEALHETQKLIKQQRPSYSKLDLLAFDACLMQSIEVASEFQYDAHNFLASMQIQNYLGLPYRAILDQLSDTQSVDRFLASLTSLVKRSFQVGEQAGLQGRHDPKAHATFTASLVGLRELREYLLPTFKVFAQSLVNYLQEEPMRMLDMQLVLEHMPAFMGETRDLGIFLGVIEKLIYEEMQMFGEMSPMALNLKQSIIQLWQNINETILANSFGPFYQHDPALNHQHNYDVKYFKGISIWIPSHSKLFEMRKQEFYNSRFYQHGYKPTEKNPWQTWLEMMFTSDHQ